MKRILKIQVIAFLSVASVTIMQSCEKQSTPPRLTTALVSGITETSAVISSNVTDDGGVEVTERGIAWGTSPNPTTSSNKTINGTGKGYFTTIINGLTANTIYYVRAYALNIEGTSYGRELSFKTSEQGKGIQKSDFPGLTRYGGTSFSIGTKLYLGLGYGDDFPLRDFWEWDQMTNQWTRKTDYPGNSGGGAVGFSIGTKGYIGTGYNINAEGSTNEFWEYDPFTDTWTQKASLPVSAARTNATGFSIGKRGYIGTGTDGTSYFRDFWEWDQETNIWTKKAEFGGIERSGAVGFSIGNKGYIGTGGDGLNGNDNSLRDFWEWDQESNVWTRKTDLGGSGRNGAVGFSIGNKGYIGMGANASYLKDFWEWDQAADTWTRKPNFEGNARSSAVGVSIGDKGYIGIGYGGFDYAFKDFWEYDPR
jgi:N-acetylneuraminic acid mutarotase